MHPNPRHELSAVTGVGGLHLDQILQYIGRNHLCLQMLLV